MFKKVNSNKNGVIEYAIDNIEDLNKLPRKETDNTVYAVLNKDGKKLVYLYSKAEKDYILINGDLEEIKDINEQLDNKANKVDLKVQSNRIDNIVAVQDATDNIETADIRVGSNGMTYNSAGESVREQTKKVHSNLGTNLVISKTPSYNTRLINLDYDYTFEVNKKYFFKPISYTGNTFNFVKIFLYREDGTYHQILVNDSGKFNFTSYIEFIPTEIFVKVRFNMETIESEIGTLTCSFGAIGDLIERVEKIENSPLKNKRIGFVGDSFTDVSYYYGKKIADRVGCIDFNYGVQGSRIFEDNSWTSNGVLVTKEAFWKRVLKMDLNFYS